MNKSLPAEEITAHVSTAIQLVPLLATPVIGAIGLVGYCLAQGASVQAVVGVDDVLLASTWALVGLAGFSGVWIYYLGPKPPPAKILPEIPRKRAHDTRTLAWIVLALSVALITFKQPVAVAFGWLFLSCAAGAFMLMHWISPRTPGSPRRLLSGLLGVSRNICDGVLLPLAILAGPFLAGYTLGLQDRYCAASPSVADAPGCYLTWTTSRAAILQCASNQSRVLLAPELTATSPGRPAKPCPRITPMLAEGVWGGLRNRLSSASAP